MLLTYPIADYNLIVIITSAKVAFSILTDVNSTNPTPQYLLDMQRKDEISWMLIRNQVILLI
jgi:hypothetical protein